ncbi:MAG: methyltransferase domain-containing protein [Leptospiraceae bacterium]|nr:methyltransferase domain-containing protein [Leptospiraceae bacterium]MCP5496070.1 methyltransferase domain-containing protein [Leptospiraceae bacterium]
MSKFHSLSLATVTKDFYKKQQQKKTRNNVWEEMAKNVGWNSLEIQGLGFELATDFPKLNWNHIHSVLDVGCGYGSLSYFLRKEKMYQGSYTGIDLIPEFIKKAKELYGSDKRNQFINGNFLDNCCTSEYDVVISIGAIGLNYDFPNEYGEKSLTYAKKIIFKMNQISKLGLSFYFPNVCNLSEETKKSGIAYYQPSSIKQIIQEANPKRSHNLKIDSYPKTTNAKTMVRIWF